MSGKLKKFLASLATAALAVAALQSFATPASAAVATNGAVIGNGITTTDLSAAGMTPALLAQALAGTNFSVSNVTYTGAPQQAGKIHIVDPAVVSFNDGVILSSGNIADVIGPNKSESTTGDMAGAADADLTNLILNTATVNPQTYDAASLEFDFVATDPNATNVFFTYSFGSEEYMEWVNLFNDVFAFWVNGKNCATIPVTDPNSGSTSNQIVSIDSINGNVNSNFYRDNGFGFPPANPLNIESDGLTVELICSEPILAGQTNHIKLAIADTSDQILDSVVMIKSGSFTTTPPESCNDGVDNADDDVFIDMEDPECAATTTPAPTGQSGVGSNGTAPPFTGNAGLDVNLDAAALGWQNIGGATVTKWTVTQINTKVGVTPAVCTITTPEYQSVVNGVIPIATAVCPVAGEYTARLSGWASPGVDSKYDYDIDFFVHNAPPEASVWNYTLASAPDANGAFSSLISVYAVDTIDASLTCSINWGDGTPEVSVPYNAQTFLCSGTHNYMVQGDYMLSVTVTDAAGSSSAVALLAQVWDTSSGLTPQSIKLKFALPTTKQYGTTFNVSATGGASGNPLIYGSAGSCTNVGNTYTMTDGSGDCIVIIDQDGDFVTYDPAPTYYGYVTATKAAVTVTAAAATKAYGTADPVFTYKTTGTIYAGDAFTGALGRTAGENVGTYPINLGNLALNSGYQITFVGANFTITGTAPAMTTQPTAKVAVPGSSVTFTAAASGNPAPTVKWQVLPVGGAWTDISGATSASYTFTPIVGDDGKQFRAVFTNAVGTVTSSAAALSVVSITSFTPTSGPVGTSVVITGTGFTGATAVTFNGIAASPVTVNSNTQITVKVPTGASTGVIAVTKGGVTATSSSAFSVTAVPAVTTQPTSQTVAGGSLVTLTAAASGSPTPTVQWQALPVGGTWANISGATSATYTFTAAGTDDAKQFRAIFTNGSGTATSTAAVLTVVSISSFTPSGGPVGTSMVITGTGFTAASAVKFNGVSATFTVNGNTQITATVPAGATTGAVTVTKGGVTATSATNFSVVVLPVVTTQPVSQAVLPGATVSFTAAATGTPTPTVKWQVLPVGGAWTDIAGATTGTYSFTAAATDDGKQYRAVFDNGSVVNSSAATLTVVSITSFTPTSGPVGSSVVITGTGFTGATAVKFGATAASAFTVNSNTQITATVATGTATGAITVTKGGVTATSATSYTVTVPVAVPTISAITPTSGGTGTTVTISGTNFTGATSVKFAGVTAGTTVAATFKVLSATSIIASVPAGSGTGGIVVTTPGGSATSGSFKGSTTLVLPTVTAYSVTSARPGSAFSVTLTGTNFAGTSLVALNGVSLAFNVVSATSMTVTIPASGVTSGPIKVTTNGGVSANTNVLSLLSAPVQISAGATHTCAALADGTAKCWGLNTNGQIGDNSTTQRTSTVLVAGLTGVSSVATGTAFSCAVLNPGATGTVKCWGLNTNGQLGDGTTTQRLTPVLVSGITGAVQIAAGASHACALLSDATVKCWGLNTNGQLGDNTTTQKTTATLVSSITGVAAISAAGANTCALLTTGAVKCWGLNTNGQLGDNTTTQRLVPTQVSGIDGTAAKATAIDVGTSHACALITDGTVRCWGLNTSGQLGDNTLVQKLVPTTVKATATTNLTGVTAISAGAAHTCAIIGSGSTATAKCWGSNANGRLGNAATTNSSLPVSVVTTITTGITAISAGGSHTVALVPSVALAPRVGAAWGLNTNGQLGDASTTQRTSPVQVATL